MLEPGVRDQGVEASEALEGRRDRNPVALARRQVSGERRPGTSRIGQPEDVAGVIAFLCSEDAAYVSGQVIYVRGGP